jgi:hypothetical protein
MVGDEFGIFLGDYVMKNVLAVVALSLALSMSACTKKEAAPEGEQVEGTTTAPTDSTTPPPAEEAQTNDTATPPPAETAPAEGHAH